MPQLFFTAALLSVALVAPSALAADPMPADNELHDEVLHLSVAKPDSWRFQTPREKRDGQNAVTYKNKSWEMAVKRVTFPPRIVISKYAEPFHGLNPRVTIDRYPLDEFRFKDGLWVAEHNLGVLHALIFTKVILPSKPGWSLLSGKLAGHYRARYELELRDLPTMRVDRRVWAVSLPLAVIFITAEGTQDGDDACATELDAIIGSIRFDS